MFVMNKLLGDHFSTAIVENHKMKRSKFTTQLIAAILNYYLKQPLKIPAGCGYVNPLKSSRFITPTINISTNISIIAYKLVG